MCRRQAGPVLSRHWPALPVPSKPKAVKVEPLQAVRQGSAASARQAARVTAYFEMRSRVREAVREAVQAPRNFVCRDPNVLASGSQVLQARQSAERRQLQRGRQHAAWWSQCITGGRGRRGTGCKGLKGLGEGEDRAVRA